MNFLLLLFSRSAMSNSLRSHGLQHLHHLLEFAQTHVHLVDNAIQPSHVLLPSSPALTSFPASGSFPMTLPFASGSQSIGTSASAQVLPVNIQS